jgi:hypothetical protein
VDCRWRLGIYHLKEQFSKARAWSGLPRNQGPRSKLRGTVPRRSSRKALWLDGTPKLFRLTRPDVHEVKDPCKKRVSGGMSELEMKEYELNVI